MTDTPTDAEMIAAVKRQLVVATDALRAISGWSHAEEWHPADDAKAALAEIESLEGLAAPGEGWQPIETAPRDSWRNSNDDQYGDWILGYPVEGAVGQCRWWQSNSAGYERYRNFLEPGGHAVYPSKWMRLPKPPVTP